MAILHHFEDFDYFVIQGILYISLLLFKVSRPEIFPGHTSIFSFLSTFRFLSYPLNYVNPAQTLITKQLAFRAICRNTLFRIL